MLTDSELSILETLHDILKALSFLTDALVGEKEVTASAMIPVLEHIKWKLTVDNANDTMLAATELKEIIWSDLESRYMQTEASEILSLASFLDLRLKNSTYMHMIEKTLYNKLLTNVYSIVNFNC